MKKDKAPNPGTEEAQQQGCECPVMDNHYGRGWDGSGKVFVYNMGCKLHKPVKVGKVDDRKKK